VSAVSAQDINDMSVVPQSPNSVSVLVSVQPTNDEWVVRAKELQSPALPPSPAVSLPPVVAAVDENDEGRGHMEVDMDDDSDNDLYGEYETAQPGVTDTGS